MKFQRTAVLSFLFITLFALSTTGWTSPPDDLDLHNASWVKEFERINGHPTIVDLDRDGRKEIFVMIEEQRGLIVKAVCLNSEGRIKWKFDFGLDSGSFTDHYKIADLDRDGKLEIVFSGRRAIFCLNHNGKLVWKHWKFEYQHFRLAAIGNLEGNDKLEILIQPEGDNPFILNHRSRKIREFIVNHNETTFDDETESTPILVDLDKDNNLDLVLYPPDEHIYVYDYNGTLKWSHYLGEQAGHTSVADVDNDGYLELFVSAMRELVFCFSYNGSLRWVFDSEDYQGLIYYSPSFVDFDGDDFMEIIFTSSSLSNDLKCLNYNGTSRWNASSWGATSSPVPALSDVDGDNEVEISINTNRGVVFYDQTGIMEELLELGDCQFESHVIGDVNDDGILEIITSNNEGKLICIQYPNAQESTSSWWTFGGGFELRGNMDSDGDYLSDLKENMFSTNKTNPDSDLDGIIDSWEVEYSLNPLVDDSLEDPDADGIINLKEFKRGLNPQKWDNWPTLYAGMLLPVWLCLSIGVIVLERKYSLFSKGTVKLLGWLITRYKLS